jgi:diadenosine tetraphosphate (Ap4A) HIT family hydrolase
MRIQRPATSPATLPVPPAATAQAAPRPAAPATSTTDVFDATHDMRHRVGVGAVVAGRTQTATPRLLDDWKLALLEAEAEQRAGIEVIEPSFRQAAKRHEAAKGAPLDRDELRKLHREIVKERKADFEVARDAHWQDINRSPSTRQQTERDVVLDQRARVAQLRDVFTPIAEKEPGARDQEIMLWENRNVMVLVDTFSPSPKALVVPKATMQLPLDATTQQLDELAVVAAHVSDAFSITAGAPAAGIWINPPQHVTIRQLHVHVLPDLPPLAADRTPTKAFLADPQTRHQVEAYFAQITQALENSLGSSV